MSSRRSVRRSWHDLFGFDVTHSAASSASLPNPAEPQGTPGTHRRPSEVKKRAKPSPPPPPKNPPRSQSPSGPKNLPGNSQMCKKRKPAPTRERVKPGKKRKLAPFERTWSTADELRILTALVEHTEAHGGALMEPSDLFAVLAGSLDNEGADTDKLSNKIRKLRRRHGRARRQGCPGDDHGLRMFELCDKVWGNGASVASRRSPRKISKGGGGGGEDGDTPTAARVGNRGLAEHVHQQVGEAAVDVAVRKVNYVPFAKDGNANSGKCKDNGGRVDEDAQVKATPVRWEFSELSRLYPYLADEVKEYANTQGCGKLIKAAFEIIDDEEARYLDERCKKLAVDKLNFQASQAELTKVLLCTLAGLIN